MVFEGLKRFFGLAKAEETPNQKMTLIDEELDEFEKEIQEYIHYSDERKEGEIGISQPAVLSQGGGRTSSSFITPEEEKRIDGE
ncbi:MAG: hypothetical protein JXA22_10625 [Candidatus Thermoplasmatota archaeon]|nr:hypothetical protein [Candidatus Thermoplasmatota archaeon]